MNVEHSTFNVEHRIRETKAEGERVRTSNIHPAKCEHSLVCLWQIPRRISNKSENGEPGKWEMDDVLKLRMLTDKISCDSLPKEIFEFK